MHLLDGDVLVAVHERSHPHHQVARHWLGADRPIATCPSTQGTLVRLLIRSGTSTADALAALRTLTQRPGHKFWPDDVGYLDVPMTGVIGHRQVTDAYLAHQARRRGAKLATLDRGLAALHPDVVELVPS